jgi:hypothetical protein
VSECAIEWCMAVFVRLRLHVLGRAPHAHQHPHSHARAFRDRCFCVVLIALSHEQMRTYAHLHSVTMQWHPVFQCLPPSSLHACARHRCHFRTCVGKAGIDGARGGAGPRACVFVCKCDLSYRFMFASRVLFLAPDGVYSCFHFGRPHLQHDRPS